MACLCGTGGACVARGCLCGTGGACVARGVLVWHGGCLCGTGVPVWHGGACVAKTAFLKATTKQKSTCIPFCVCTYYNLMIKSEVCV